MARTKFMLTGRYSAGGMFPAKTPDATTKKSRSGKRKPKSGATRADKKKRQSGFYGSQMPREHKGPRDLKDGATVLVKWPDNIWRRGEVVTVYAKKYIVYDWTVETVQYYLVEKDTLWKRENLDYDSEDEDVEMDCYVSKKDDAYVSESEVETDVQPRKPSNLVPVAVIKEEPEAEGDFATTPVVNKDEKPLGRLAKAKAAAHLAMSTEEAKQNPLGAAGALFDNFSFLDDDPFEDAQDDTPRKQPSFSQPLTPQPPAEHGDNESDTFGGESEVKSEVEEAAETEVETDDEVDGEDIPVEERMVEVEQPVAQEEKEKKQFSWDDRDLNVPSDDDDDEWKEEDAIPLAQEVNWQVIEEVPEEVD